MRDIPASAVTAAVKALCVPANNQLPPDVEAAVRGAYESEPWPIAKQTLGTLCQNLDAARATGLPICQDTGMACVFAEIGQDVHITGGSFEEAVDEGVRQGYTEGYLRKSVVADPIRRGNTGDNTPAVLTVRLVPGDKLRLTLAPKGFGSENMSRLAMLRPSDGEQGVKDFVLDAVRRAGPNPCPPVVVGVGIGASKIGAEMRKDLFNHIQTLSMRYFDDTNTGELMARVKDDVDKIQNALGYVGMLLIEVTIHVVFVLYCMFSLNWKMAFLPVTVMLCCAVVAIIMERKLDKVYEDISEENAVLTTVAEENLAGVRTVKAFAREDYEIKKFLSHNERYYNLNISFLAISWFGWSLSPG